VERSRAASRLCIYESASETFIDYRRKSCDAFTKTSLRIEKSPKILRLIPI